MKIRFASWNVNSRQFTVNHRTFIEEMNIDVLALQEARLPFHLALEETGLFDWARTSLRLVSVDCQAHPSRLLGCSIFGKSSVPPLSTMILDHVVFPERTIMVTVETCEGEIRLGSFHIPPGASWKSVKPETMVQVAGFLSTLSDPTIIGIDANAPKTDHPDHCQNAWWWKDEPRLLGHDPEHHLRDALRVKLENNAELAEEVQAARPYGPLAISRIRGRGQSRTACRYDFVLTSPDFRVDNVSYHYKKSIEAGSDHAMVVADLGLPARRG